MSLPTIQQIFSKAILLRTAGTSITFVQRCCVRKSISIHSLVGRCCNCTYSQHLSVQKRRISLSTIFKKQNDEQQKPENEAPVSIKNRLIITAIFVSVVGAGFYYMEQKKQTEKLQKRETQVSKVDIGASDYDLTDNKGNRVSKKDFLDKWLLLYFGFTHCPDICPEELERMSDIVDIISKSYETNAGRFHFDHCNQAGEFVEHLQLLYSNCEHDDQSIPSIQPIFVSVDPERDTPEAITTYLADFHPTFIGLTGTSEEVKHATKVFRVYYQAGPKDNDNDYIVDHTIVMYLINPKGNFVDYYGSRSTPIHKIVTGIKKNMENYKRLHG